ncbi:unnamed protein product [Microthlaspi erraticum]|uniref:Uncharacterized protein n=1 Tax=Microthlaspi erraticum TaxID=1685480 RepID=A0A6D2KNA8_9BRAS|nr:unnamed protein product [Microthlaspi erraticum]
MRVEPCPVSSSVLPAARVPTDAAAKPVCEGEIRIGKNLTDGFVKLHDLNIVRILEAISCGVGGTRERRFVPEIDKATIWRRKRTEMFGKHRKGG